MIDPSLAAEIRVIVRSELIAGGYTPRRRRVARPHPHEEAVRAYLAGLPAGERTYGAADLLDGYVASEHAPQGAPPLALVTMGMLASRLPDIMGRRRTEMGSQYWRLAPGQLGGGGG